MIVESHTMNVKLHSGTKLHSGVKLQNEVWAHSNFEISVHERDFELPDRDIVIQKLRDQMKKPNLNQDCLIMSRDITLLHK